MFRASKLARIHQQRGKIVVLEKSLFNLSTGTLFRLEQYTSARSLIDDRLAGARTRFRNQISDILQLKELAEFYERIECWAKAISIIEEARSKAETMETAPALKNVVDNDLKRISEGKLSG